MRRLKLFILLGFAIMFVAGLEVGRSHTTVASLKGDWNSLLVYAKLKTPETISVTPAVKPEEFLLFKTIKLTKSQHEQIQKIFGDSRAKTDLMSRQYGEFDREREDAILAMLSPEQKWEYEQIQHERDVKIAGLRTQISTMMKKAGDDVRAILDTDQQKQFDDERAKWDRDIRRLGGPHNRHPHGGPDTAPDHSVPLSPPK